MNLSKVWTIAAKDLRIFLKKKGILYGVILLPLITGIGLPLVIGFAGRGTGGIPATALPPLLDAFAFFFIISADVLPTAIAAYSLVGEKVEKSLEPLLATPTTDSELLLGKSVAAFIPPILAIYAGAAVFMALTDRFTYGTLGYLYFPNWKMGIILLAVTPLAAVLSIEVNVIISSRVSDIRTAQQLGSLLALPFGAIYVAAEARLIALTTSNLLLISGMLAVIDWALFYASTAVFHREEILTRWK